MNELTFWNLSGEEKTLFSVKEFKNPTSKDLILVQYVGKDRHYYAHILVPGYKIFIPNLTPEPVELTVKNISMWMEQLNNWLAIDSL